MVELEGYLADLEVAPTRTAIDKIQTLTEAEFETINVDAIYSTVSCEGAEQENIEGSILLAAIVDSLVGALLEGVEDGSLVHHPTEYYYSHEGDSMFILYGLPASEFGYVRAITITHLGKPVPFMTTVLDAALPTGLITSVSGKSSTVVQKLKYIARGRRNSEEYESDEIDLSGAVPPEVSVTIRRKTTSKMNRKKMR